MPQTTMWRALNRALRDVMAEHDDVVLLGEDITTWGTGGGIYGVTKGIGTAFGPARVRQTPISEEAMVAIGVGSAMAGIRPVVEIMYSDFTMLTMDGLVNQAAKVRDMFDGQFTVPLTIRTNGGSQMGKAGQHSQSLETVFAHIPGLTVYTPSTPNDAYWLLRHAVESDDPAIFLEHKAMYDTRGEVDFDHPVGLGAEVRAEGSRITVVASQLMLDRVNAVADELVGPGVCEIVDPRTIYPMDLDTITASVRKTGALLVVHEAVADFGWGHHVASSIADLCWNELRTAPRVLGATRAAIPYAESLEREAIPTQRLIAEELGRMLQREGTGGMT